jgi:hypothetical protein
MRAPSAAATVEETWSAMTRSPAAAALTSAQVSSSLPAASRHRATRTVLLLPPPPMPMPTHPSGDGAHRVKESGLSFMAAG